MINTLLKKGGAGASLGRAETIDRLNPLIHRHYELNHYYEAARRRLGPGEVSDAFARQQKIARADIGKLNETVFSNGGVAYNGTDLEPEDYTLPADEDRLLFRLLDLEDGFGGALASELAHKPQHQIRTLAILGVLREHSQERLAYLRDLTRSRTRPE